VFKNRVKRKIFGPKRDKVTGECKRPHSEELHDLTAQHILFGSSEKNNEIGGAHST